MADDFDNDDDLVPRSQIRQLEEKARRTGELEAQVAQMQRETAFARALGNLEHPGRSYFEKGYDGPLESEAITEAARQAGFLAGAPPAAQQGQQPPAQSGPTATEMAAHARMAAASEGGSGNRPIDLIEALGPRGSKSAKEITELLRAAGPNAPFRLAEDMQ